MSTEQVLTERSHKGIVITLVIAVLIAILSFPLFFFTYSFLKASAGRLTVSASAFYVEHWWDMFTLACAFAGPTVLFLIGISVYAALRTNRLRWSLITLPFAFVLELAAMAVIPNLPIWNLEIAQNINYLGGLEHRLRNWDQKHGRFPLTRDELDDATRDITARVSMYRQGNRTLDFQIELVSSQDGPYRANPERPGIVYYAVNPTGTQFWLTASGLNAPYGERATMAHTYPLISSKQPWGDLLVITDVSVSYQKR